MRKFLTGIICFLIFSVTSQAQRLSALESYPLSGYASAFRLARTLADGDTLRLPFFDDFAAYTGSPSLLYWQKGGGVFVNDQFGVDPPSLHVATFEGLRANGEPYSNIASYGFTDTLTSKPIWLDGLSAASNVYLSFYWQAGGLGGAPNTESGSQPSFLSLEFKDRNGNWVQVWKQPGENRKTNFAQVVVPVTEAAYFHKGFQFRFRSSGLRKSNDDAWNVDYVYLDRNRDPARPNRPDVALNQRLSPLLERYTAMPVKQFLANPAAELNDSAYSRLNNFNLLFAPITWRGYLRVLSPATPADTFLRGNAAVPPQAVNYLISGKPNAAAIPNSSNQLLIRHALFLRTREADARLRQNDTVTRTTELHDFYAYDDGTAETNFSLSNAGNRQLAYRFDLNQSDHVRAIRVYLTKTNVAGHVINFRVWDDDNGNPAATVKAARSFTIPAVQGLNQFFDITLPQPVPVSGSFHIGFSIGSSVNDFVNIGYDLNERAPGRIRYNNNGTGWFTFNDVPGALMLRPVMGTVTAGPEDPAAGAAAFRVFPNPGTGLFTVQGDYQDLCVADLTGKIIQCQTRKEAGNRLDLRGQAPGLYLLRLTGKNKTQTFKIILTR